MDRKQLTAQVKLRILKRDKFTCQYCGTTGADSDLEIDHKHPVSKGGTNDDSNLVTACYECNRTKTNNVGWKPISNNSNDFYYIRDGRYAQWLSSIRDWDDDKEDLLRGFYRINKNDALKEKILAEKICPYDNYLTMIQLNLTEGQMKNIIYFTSWKECIDQFAIDHQYWYNRYNKKEGGPEELRFFELYYNPNF